MKLKTKLLSIIAPAALLTSVAPIALTSCSGDGSSSSHMSCDQKKQTVTTADTMTPKWTINLKTALADGEEITLTDSVTYSAMNHISASPMPSFIIESKTSNSLVVKGTFSPSDNISTGEKWDNGNATFKLNFEVKKSGTQVWAEGIELQFAFSK